MNLIYMTNTGATSVLSGATVPLNVSRRKGCYVTSSGNAILLNKPGYYHITGSISFSSEAGNAEFVVEKNGLPVEGINATVTAVTDTIYNVALDGVVRVFCSEGAATLTLVNTGVGVTTTNVALTVEYE